MRASRYLRLFVMVCWLFILQNWGKQLVEVVERTAAIKDNTWMRDTL